MSTHRNAMVKVNLPFNNGIKLSYFIITWKTVTVINFVECRIKLSKIVCF